MSNLKKLSTSRDFLRMVAVISLFIGHIYTSILWRYFIVGSHDVDATIVYVIAIVDMLGINHIAFIIAAFFVVRGLSYTAHRYIYGIRLLTLAVISEIPYDLCVNHRGEDFSKQNVVFTLLLGYLLICLLEYVKDVVRDKSYFERIMLNIGLIIMFILTATFLRLEYSISGILLISTLYLLQSRKIICGIMSVISVYLGMAMEFIWSSLLLDIQEGLDWKRWDVLKTIIGQATEKMSMTIPVTVLSILFLLFYDEKKGKIKNIYFYLFYPAHMLLLWGISLFV